MAVIAATKAAAGPAAPPRVIAESAAAEPRDAVAVELAAVLSRLEQLATTDVPADDRARIDLITLLERVKVAAAAVQGEQMVAFPRSQVEQHLRDADVDPAAVGRGIADQIALACRVSPSEGSRRLGVARALHSDLPATAALLRSGRISEYVSAVVVSETRHLTPELRRQVDGPIAAGVEGSSPRQAAATARRLAYQVDPAGFVARGRTQRADRRVTIRPAPDTMAMLTGFLPAEQRVACWAAPRRHADAVIAKGGDGRTRDQVMADTLVERVTGQATAADVDVEVGIVIPLDALVDPPAADTPAPDAPAPDVPAADATTAPAPPAVPRSGRRRSDSGRPSPPAPGSRRPGCPPLPSRASERGWTAELIGYGPLPADLARQLIATSRGRRWWRRLFSTPGGGVLVGGDPRRRRFDGPLAHLIAVRDGGRCRDPFCDAPIRHIDHITPHRAGGATSYANGRGVCVRGNRVKEMPGWRLEAVHDGLTGPPHTVRTTTPTGHAYISTARPAAYSPRRWSRSPTSVTRACSSTPESPDC